MNFYILFGWNFLAVGLPMILALVIIIACVIAIGVAICSDVQRHEPNVGDE